MGEIAEMMLDGTMCAGCGEWLNGGEDGDGYPGYCASCAPSFDDRPRKAKPQDDVQRIARNAANAAIRAAERSISDITNFKFSLSEKSKSKMRRSLICSVISNLNNQKAKS